MAKAFQEIVDSLHITVRLSEGVTSLRSQKAFRVFRNAVKASQVRGLRILQFAVLGNHFHLLAEADNSQDLTSSMKSLNIRLALGLKKLATAKGPVVKDRFDLKILKTPTQVRNALVYILANASKHFKRGKVFDWFSSYAIFSETLVLKSVRCDLSWEKPEIPTHVCKAIAEMVSHPRSWLATKGWKKSPSG